MWGDEEAAGVGEPLGEEGVASIEGGCHVGEDLACLCGWGDARAVGGGLLLEQAAAAAVAILDEDGDSLDPLRRAVVEQVGDEEIVGGGCWEGRKELGHALGSGVTVGHDAADRHVWQAGELLNGSTRQVELVHGELEAMCETRHVGEVMANYPVCNLFVDSLACMANNQVNTCIVAMIDEPDTPELTVLRKLRSTCVLMRRNAESIELAKVILAEEERLAKRIDRIRGSLAVVTVVANSGANEEGLTS